MLGRKVLVKRTVVLPPKQQVILQAEVEGLNDEPVYAINPVLLQINSTLLSDYGILPARSVHDSTNNGVPVMLYNANNFQVELPSNVVLGEFEGLDEIFSEELISETSSEKVRSCEIINDQVPPHVQVVYKASCEHLEEPEKRKLREFLCEYADLFSKDEADLGCTGLVKHKIYTGDAVPKKFPPRRLGPEAKVAADELVDDLLQRGLIRKSNSPWGANIVMVRKRDNSYRMCCDFRALNSVSKQDAYPLPRINETLESLGKNKYWCTSDLSSGYYQVEMSPESIEKTAFCTRKGLFEWNVMPFGLTGAVGTFQRLMENVLGDLRYTSSLCYIDDLITYGADFASTLKNLKDLCDKLRAARLKLKPKKCRFFQKSVLFLGHKISENGIETDPAKVEAVSGWKSPKNKTDVKAFLGTVGYYRRFIQNYSDIAKPLTALTSKSVDFKWSDDCQNAVNLLKSKLMTAPILGYPKDKGEFVLDTDASSFATGAVLSQIQDGKEVVIAYGSRTLNEHELNYCVTRKELLAIVQHIRLFREYLLGKHFRVRTDHSALKYWRNFKDPFDQLGRWLDFLQSFDF